MKKTIFYIVAAVTALMSVTSCEIDGDNSGDHMNHGYLEDMGRECMNFSVVNTCATLADLLAIQAFLDLPEEEQNSDSNYGIRSKLVSKDRTDCLKHTDYGFILTRGQRIDVEGGEWLLQDTAVKCLGDGHWSLQTGADFSCFGLKYISCSVDIRRDESAPDTYSLGVVDGICLKNVKYTLPQDGDEGKRALPVVENADDSHFLRFSTVSDFRIDRASDGMDGVFLVEVAAASGETLDWVKVNSVSRVGQGYSISVDSSRRK